MDTEQFYYTRLAAAYVRGYLTRKNGLLPEGQQSAPDNRWQEQIKSLVSGPLEELTFEELKELVEVGRNLELKMYRFKRNPELLPRVKYALGCLNGIYPESVCDVGSGRGVFLFPFLERFPWVNVTSIDLLPHRVCMLQDLSEGGIGQLTAMEADICSQPLADDSVDVVTALEVLEHIPDVRSAILSVVRMARRYVIVTVPSKPDNNPEHIHLLTKNVLTEYFHEAGCERLQFGGVPGHLTLLAALPE